MTEENNNEATEVTDEIELPKIGRQFSMVVIKKSGWDVLIAPNKAEYNRWLETLKPHTVIFSAEKGAYENENGDTVLLFDRIPRRLRTTMVDDG